MEEELASLQAQVSSVTSPQAVQYCVKHQHARRVQDERPGSGWSHACCIELVQVEPCRLWNADRGALVQSAHSVRNSISAVSGREAGHRWPDRHFNCLPCPVSALQFFHSVLLKLSPVQIQVHTGNEIGFSNDLHSSCTMAASACFPTCCADDARVRPGHISNPEQSRGRCSLAWSKTSQ